MKDKEYHRKHCTMCKGITLHQIRLYPWNTHLIDRCLVCDNEERY